MKWVHIIGVAGVTTSALAVMFKNLKEYLGEDWKITGSDENIYSPADTILKNHGVQLFNSFHYSHLINENNEYPDLVVLGSSKSLSNKEYLFAKKNNLNIKSYPEILGEYVVKENNSIVVAGTYGKSSITAMIIYCLRQKFEISYMLGAYCDSITPNILPKSSDTKWSVVEGDEYMTSRADKQSKFFHYSPTHLILSSLEWDHTDLFKTKEEYIINFINLAKRIPKEGYIFYRDKEVDTMRVINSVDCNKIYVEIKGEKNISNSKWNILGKFNWDNQEFVEKIVTNEIFGVDINQVNNDDKPFSGIKRRFEVRYKSSNLENNLTDYVIDDFGSSPAKAKGAIQSARELFPTHNIVAVFEPNEGSRTEESIELYNQVFNQADTVIFPKFRAIQNRFSQDILKEKLNLKNKNIYCEDETMSLSELIMKSYTKGSIFLFLGSHSFETEIQNLIINLKKLSN